MTTVLAPVTAAVEKDPEEEESTDEEDKRHRKKARLPAGNSQFKGGFDFEE